MNNGYFIISKIIISLCTLLFIDYDRKKSSVKDLRDHLVTNNKTDWPEKGGWRSLFRNKSNCCCIDRSRDETTIKEIQNSRNQIIFLMSRYKKRNKVLESYEDLSREQHLLCLLPLEVNLAYHFTKK